MTDPRRELESTFERLAQDGYCVDPVEVAREGLGLLTPPERISITDCAAQGRLIPNAEGGARLWSPNMTPYINGIQDAIDDPLVRVVAAPGAARTGKTLAPENALFKRMKYGPMTDVLWYLPGGLLDDYVDTTVTPLFDLHPDLAAKIGTRPSDNKRTLKKLAGRFIRYLSATLANTRGKQAPFIVGDEIDGFPKKLRSNFRQQMAIRARAYGNIGKGYVCSHPDAGWTDGIAAIWLESTRGVWYWPCPECDQVSSPCPTADWRMKLDYERPKGMADGDMLAKVEATACMICPHCGSAIGNEHKAEMNARGQWVHDGQTIALDGTITGDVTPNDTWGFWISGYMSPMVSWGQLAKELVGALQFFERTGKSDRLREITAKSLGEVYEGPSGRRVDLKRLQARMDAGAEDEGYDVGEVPGWVRFITATVDVGGNKFDAMFTGWGADAESAIIARETLVAMPSGEKLKPPLVQSHWDILETRVLDRQFPIKGRPGWVLGVANMIYDTGGAPGTTWQAREFTRRMMKGKCSGSNAYRCRPIKGSQLKKAPELGNPREVNKDDKGKAIVPSIFETDLGVFKLKTTVTERLAIDAPGPGYTHMPRGGDPKWAEELTNETLIDDEFVRKGDNETFDLLVYAEAARLMLQPDRAEINWDRPPVWARPVEARAKPTNKPAAAAKLTPEQEKAERRRQLIERISR